MAWLSIEEPIYLNPKPQIFIYLPYGPTEAPIYEDFWGPMALGLGGLGVGFAVWFWPVGRFIPYRNCCTWTFNPKATALDFEIAGCRTRCLRFRAQSHERSMQIGMPDIDRRGHLD